MSPLVSAWVSRCMHDHVFVDGMEKAKEALSYAYNCREFYVNVQKEEWKLDTLCDVLDHLEMPSWQSNDAYRRYPIFIVYVNTYSKVGWLWDKMSERDFPMVHGDMDQKKYNIILEQFRSKTVSTPSPFRVIVTTDLFARGIKVQKGYYEKFVFINYDYPTNRENYIRRIGRSDGRYVNRTVLNFVTAGDARYKRDIQEMRSELFSSPGNLIDLPDEMPINIADLI
jgi:superfamily II DNA/RNA helicase